MRRINPSKFRIATRPPACRSRSRTPEGPAPLAQLWAPSLSDAVAGLNEQGYWPARLGSTSHPFTRQAAREITPGDFSETHVGDETDTSPFPDQTLTGISTAA